MQLTTNSTITTLVEIPEELYTAARNHLETHPDWDYNRVFTAALSLFLLQNGTNSTPTASQEYRRAARIYLDSLFTNPTGGDK